MRNRKKRSGVMIGWLSIVLALPGIAAADNVPNIVTNWSLNATQAVVTKGGRAGFVEFAIVHAAMFDAVNAIERRYAVYKVDPAAPSRGASPEAAAAAAAHRALVGLFPEQALTLDAAYAASLATLPDNAARTKGIALGEEVAVAMLALRANDGRGAAVPAYVFGYGPGVYQQTTPYPPTGQPVNTFLPGVTPMVLSSAWQFRAYGPPGLTSARYTHDLEEVRQFGALNSAVRTETQSEIGRFHTENPNQFWGRNLSNFVASRNLGTLGSARLMTLFAFAEADASIACFDSKYAYNFWRPSTAIQQADSDGNPATQVDPAWVPYQNTPPHPEYPAAHGCVAGAITQIMEEYFGRQRVKFAFNSTVTGTVHIYGRPQDLVDEIADARVYGGMHFRSSVRQGEALGSAVAKWAAKHSLQSRDKGH
jgi:hypothetical protein